MSPIQIFLGDVDLVVIGSGPGGYVAAIKAAQLGMNVSFDLKTFIVKIRPWTCWSNINH